MGIFDLFKKKIENQQLNESLYNCLFADDPKYFSDMRDIECISWIFSDRIPEIQKLNDWAKDDTIESRLRFLCLYSALKRNLKIDKKIYFGTILEVPVNNGYDILAFYSDKKARYYNFSGAAVIYENGNLNIDSVIDKVNKISIKVCDEIGPWEGGRLPRPNGSTARFTYLMSDGIYFGNGPISELSKDPMGSAILISGAEIMKILINTKK